MSSVPAKYQPEPRKWEQESWLREKYWDEMLSLSEIAELVTVSHKTVRQKMVELGIDRRDKGNQDFSKYDPEHESGGYDESYEQFLWK